MKILKRVQDIDSVSPLSIENIRYIEDELQIQFPAQYTEFMLELNGGTVLPCAFYIETDDPLDTHWLEVDWFYPAVIDKNYTTNLTLQKRIKYQNRHGPSEGLNPTHSIPIANVIGTDDLLLFVDGEHRGEVWVKLWHMCDDVDFPNPWSWCYKVGDDLFDFLGKLEEGPD